MAPHESPDRRDPRAGLARATRPRSPEAAAGPADVGGSTRRSRSRNRPPTAAGSTGSGAQRLPPPPARAGSRTRPRLPRPPSLDDDDEPPPELVWYVLKVQSSREDTIRDALERRVKIQGLQRYFGQIVVPTEKITEIRNNKKRIVERKTYPGYIMVEMELNEKTWFVVRETPGVGDFVGAHGTPTKMTEAEVNQMLGQETANDRPRPPRSGSTSSAATASRSRTARSRTSRGPSRKSSRPAAWSRSC